MTTARLSPGVYQVEHNGFQAEVKRHELSTGGRAWTWTGEVADAGDYFRTKADAKEAFREFADTAYWHEDYGWVC